MKRLLFLIVVMGLLSLALIALGFYYGTQFADNFHLDEFMITRTCNFYQDAATKFALVFCSDGTIWNTYPRLFIWGKEL